MSTERHDYVSPGYERVAADSHFPGMIEGDPTKVAWPYMRQEDPHKWYCDRTMPTAGFINRDEVHILYNTALRFAGRPALEIGCLFGWSTWHLREAGVALTVIEPLLRREWFREKLFSSLSERVAWIAEESPAALDRHSGPWELVFIDANHDAPHPLIDAAAAAHYAAEDALILFHDVLCPDVFEAVQFLRWQGWKARLYHTSQVMAAAWRGNARPIDHRPDPAITALPLPEHLMEWRDDGFG